MKSDPHVRQSTLEEDLQWAKRAMLAERERDPNVDQRVWAAQIKQLEALCNDCALESRPVIPKSPSKLQFEKNRDIWVIPCAAP